MCGCKDCKGITLFKGADGRGIVSITDNGDGTLTVLYTDGTIYITPDLTGPQGIQGNQGPQGVPGIQGDPGTNGLDGVSILRRTNTLAVSPTSLIPYNLDNSALADDNDGIKITFFVVTANECLTGNIEVKWEGTPIYTVSSFLKGSVQEVTVFLTRSNLDMVGYGTTKEFKIPSRGNFAQITETNWFTITGGDITITSTTNAEVSVGQLTIERLQAV